MLLLLKFHLFLGETLIEGAIRETKEETGCDIKITNILPILEFHKNDETIIRITYLSEVVKEGEIIAKNEILQKRWFTAEEIKTMLGALMHITYAASVNDNYTPAVRIDSLRDDFIFPTTNEYLDINGLHIDIDNANVEIQSYFDSIHIYTSKLTNLDSSDNDEHLINSPLAYYNKF